MTTAKHTRKALRILEKNPAKHTSCVTVHFHQGALDVHGSCHPDCMRPSHSAKLNGYGWHYSGGGGGVWTLKRPEVTARD